MFIGAFQDNPKILSCKITESFESEIVEKY
jgi:hypothetical protein